MKRPIWATVVGVLGIIFGLGGLIYSVQLAAMPKIVEIKRAMLADMETKAKTDQEVARVYPELKAAFEKFLSQKPAWFDTFSVSVGIIGIIINCVYIFSAISFFRLKKYAIRLFYNVISLSVGLVVARTCIFAAAYPNEEPVMLFSGLIGAVLDLILLVVVLTGDKAVFQPQADPALTSPPTPSPD